MANADKPSLESDLGDFGEDSLEIDIDFEQSLNQNENAPFSKGLDSRLLVETQDTIEKSIVLFEPLPYGIGTHLKKIGYPVHEVLSGIEVMQEIATTETGIVLCGPAGDAEHRRLLTAAIRSRFPELAIVYVSTHAQDPRALAAAKTEGAHELLPVPLPSDQELGLFFAKFGNIRKRSVTDIVEGPGSAKVPKSSDAESGTKPINAPRQTNATSTEASELPPGSWVDAQSEADGDNIVKAAGPEDPDSGEIGSLLKAISPFLWGLEDAALWIGALSAEDNEEAAKHARTLHLLNGLLKQLKDRIDAKGL